MDNYLYQVSVIIPTHNRKDTLENSLNALGNQTFLSSEYEVIVVADGCIDGTSELLMNYQAPFHLQVIQQPGRGPAYARNAGAASAKGKILLFLDDDIEASPQMIEAHLAKHQQAFDRVVIGYLPTVLKFQKGIFRTKLREWWEDMFSIMNQKGHRFNFRNLLSGNFSITSKFFGEVGGFNTDFKCQEDYELGLRLIKAQANYIYAPQARGYHHEITELDRSLYRKYQEGEAAVQFAKTYPEIIYELHLIKALTSREPNKYRKLLHYIFNWPSLSGFVANYTRRSLDIFEWFRMRRTWQNILDWLMAYWYLRGLADAAGNMHGFTKLFSEQPGFASSEQPEPHLILDIMDGLETAEEKLDLYRPHSIHIMYGLQSVGKIDFKNGYERFRGTHFRAILAKQFATPLLDALEQANQNEKRLFPDISVNPFK